MATYTPGIDEDQVIKTTSVDQALDLTVFIKKFQELKTELLALPKLKTVPDNESMNHWNGTVYEEGQTYKAIIDERAVELYNEATAIKNAGLLPSKYDDEYEQLENYVNSLT
jgi:hypothetical protein